jgi:hypothetical protein
MWILVNSDAAPLKALDVSNYLSDQKDGEVSELKHDPDLLHIIKLSMSQIIREIVIQMFDQRNLHCNLTERLFLLELQS